MVKLGFVVEDKAFEATIKSLSFHGFLKENNIGLTGIYNLGGRDKLRNRNDKVADFFKKLIDIGSDFIIVLVDKETDPCITFTKSNIYKFDKKKQIDLVAAKSIESWFLADSITLSKIFGKKYKFENPEDTTERAFDILKKEFLANTKKGLGKKRNRHASFIIKSGFSIQNAAKHPNCPSAKYFLKKLSELNPNI